jgi:hypothetical protein
MHLSSNENAAKTYRFNYLRKSLSVLYANTQSQNIILRYGIVCGIFHILFNFL